MSSWINRIIKKALGKPETPNTISFTLKGEAWPKKGSIESDNWDDGWRAGVQYTWENYHIDDNDRPNIMGGIVSEAHKVFKKEWQIPCWGNGFMEGITSGLGQIWDEYKKQVKL